MTALALVPAAWVPSSYAAAGDPQNSEVQEVLRADWIVQPDGTLQPDMAVVVQDGRIRQVLTAADAEPLDACYLGRGSVLCPGLIDLFGTIGAHGQTAETAEVVDPGARAADALDPYRGDFTTALKSGITTAVVGPAPHNLVAGTSICFRTRTRDDQLDILREDGPLVFSIGARVWQRERAPTSRSGLLFQFRDLVHGAQAGQADPRINAAVMGRSDAVIFCDQGSDVAAVRDVLGDRAGQFVVVLSEDALDLARDTDGWPRPVVVGPYTFSTARRELMGAGMLAKKGVAIAFRSQFPDAPPEGLRITAALAVRCGMPPDAARRAMTIVPAQVAGVTNRIGAIAPGLDADLVVFSGDPLRLDSSVRAVYVRGIRAFSTGAREPEKGGNP